MVVTVTPEAGWAASRTVKVPVEPSGTVTAAGVTTSDCSTVASSSTSVALTVAPVTPVPLTLKEAVPAVVSESWAAARVTVCAVLQFDGVKVSEAPELTVRSVSPLVRAVVTVTFELGAEESLAVNVAVPPSLTATALAEVTTDGVVGVVPPQVVPLTLNEVGFGLVPDQVPLKPTETEAPVARLPLYGMLVPVTREPD